MTTTSTNQSANKQTRSTDQGNGQGKEQKAPNDYINHYLMGETIFYIYKVTPYTNQDTGEITHFYKGNIKTGPKKGDIYIPVEGTLSNNAVNVLESIFDLLNSDDTTVKRSVGVTVKAPRFEGVSGFITNDDKLKLQNGEISIDEIKPVNLARFRLNFITNMRVFKRDVQAPDNRVHNGKSAKAANDDDWTQNIPN